MAAAEQQEETACNGSRADDEEPPAKRSAIRPRGRSKLTETITKEKLATVGDCGGVHATPAV
jgi:hypothetical protein